MSITKHCELCDNRLFDFESGTTCQLTNSKPDFKGKCPDIKFETKYEEVIKEINVEHHLIKITKGNAIANFLFFLIAGAVIIIGGFLIGKYALDKGLVSTVPLIIMGVGLLVLPLGFGAFNKYRHAMDKDLHGNLEMDPQVRFSRKHYK